MAQVLFHWIRHFFFASKRCLRPVLPATMHTVQQAWLQKKGYGTRHEMHLTRTMQAHGVGTKWRVGKARHEVRRALCTCSLHRWKRQSNHIAHFDEGSKATQGMQAWPALSASLAFLRFEGGGRTDSELGLCTDSAALPS